MSTIAGQHVGFGLIHGFQPFVPERMIEEARQAEELGFDLFCVADHLHGTQPTPETWTALTWVAAITEHIGVMSDVLGLPYRSPAVTAKMAETLDRLSGGRLVLGLGTGGHEGEFSAFGLARRTPGEKVSALGEAVEIIRGLWREPGFSFAGEHFRTSDAQIEPRPAHPIPIWLGAYGPRSLRMTGALADGWVPSIGRIDLDQAVAMRATVRAAAEKAGRDPDEITCAVNLVADSAPGDSEAVAERLIEIGQAGFTFFNVALADAGARRRFAAEVMPLVRDQLHRTTGPRVRPRGSRGAARTAP